MIFKIQRWGNKSQIMETRDDLHNEVNGPKHEINEWNNDGRTRTVG